MTDDKVGTSEWLDETERMAATTSHVYPDWALGVAGDANVVHYDGSDIRSVASVNAAAIDHVSRLDPATILAWVEWSREMIEHVSATVEGYEHDLANSRSWVAELQKQLDVAGQLVASALSPVFSPFMPRKCGHCGSYSDAPASDGCPPGAHMLAEMYAMGAELDRVRLMLEWAQKYPGEHFEGCPYLRGDGECACGCEFAARKDGP